jgi:acyl transferase domain-containing protein
MFDAAAFGVSGVEAMLMDVQQRMLLELSLTALTGASAAAAAAAAGKAALQSSTSSSSIVSGDQHGCIAVGIASAEYNNYLLQRTGAATSAYSATGERCGCMTSVSGHSTALRQHVHVVTQHIATRWMVNDLHSTITCCSRSTCQRAPTPAC